MNYQLRNRKFALSKPFISFIPVSFPAGNVNKTAIAMILLM